MSENKSLDPAARRSARHYALQAIYQWQIADTSLNDIETQFIASQITRKIDLEYFKDLLQGTVRNYQELDHTMRPYLGRIFEEMDPIELAVLRLATYELTYRIDVPYKVVINEALELTKKFGSVEGFKFVNGVLDRVAKKVRAVEIGNK